jgi:hypothetical protein
MKMFHEFNETPVSAFLVVSMQGNIGTFDRDSISI